MMFVKTIVMEITIVMLMEDPPTHPSSVGRDDFGNTISKTPEIQMIQQNHISLGFWEVVKINQSGIPGFSKIKNTICFGNTGIPDL